jgi:hypothetical protein
MAGFIVSILTALGWATAYVLIIRRGFLEKTYGMPMVALAGNIVWEFLFGFFIREPGTEPNYVWVIINAVWFGMDVIIFWQVLKFGMNEKWPSKRFFYNGIVLAVIFAVGAELAITYQLSDWEGQYASFIDNLMMSVLFINMFYNRGVRGQSIYIAISKMIGTLAISIAYLVRYPSAPLQWYLSASILFFDLLYTGLLYARLHKEKINPWTRL